MTNKYSKAYYKICDRAVNRPKKSDTYYERHHILPKSLGGPNEKSNLVFLTGREHFICHWLLIKFTTGKDKAKMVFAWHRMSFSSKFHKERYIPSSRIYEICRREISECQKGKIISDEQRKKISIGVSGDKNGNYGKIRSQEHCNKISESQKKNPNRSQLGKIRSAEHSLKIAEGQKRRWKNHIWNDNDTNHMDKIRQNSSIMKRKLAYDRFVEKATLRHSGRYLYDTIYKNLRTKILITCPDHGCFSQIPRSHLSLVGGCPSCVDIEPVNS